VRLNPRRGAVLVLVVTGCASPSNDAVRREVEVAESVERSQQVDTRRLELDVGALVSTFTNIDAEYQRASERFRIAAAAADNASAQYAMAEQSYQYAEQSYRWIVYVIVIAAAHDDIMESADRICTGIQSTRSYRRSNGIDDSSVCVDHVFPHALGGVNHPLNYQPLLCSTNSSLGAAFWGKFADYPVAMLQGLAVTALARLRCSSQAGAWSR
jgi:hypothetical protein